MWPLCFFFFLRCYYQNTNFTPQPLSWVAVGSRYRGVLWCHISVCERVITEGLTGPAMGARWNVMLYLRPREAQEGRCETGARRTTSAVVIGAAAALSERESAADVTSSHTELLLCPSYSVFLWVCPCPQPLTATARKNREWAADAHAMQQQGSKCLEEICWDSSKILVILRLLSNLT